MTGRYCRHAAPIRLADSPRSCRLRSGWSSGLAGGAPDWTVGAGTARHDGGRHFRRRRGRWDRLGDLPLCKAASMRADRSEPVSLRLCGRSQSSPHGGDPAEAGGGVGIRPEGMALDPRPAPLRNPLLMRALPLAFLGLGVSLSPSAAAPERRAPTFEPIAGTDLEEQLVRAHMCSELSDPRRGEEIFQPGGAYRQRISPVRPPPHAACGTS